MLSSISSVVMNMKSKRSVDFHVLHADETFCFFNDFCYRTMDIGAGSYFLLNTTLALPRRSSQYIIPTEKIFKNYDTLFDIDSESFAKLQRHSEHFVDVPSYGMYLEDFSGPAPLNVVFNPGKISSLLPTPIALCF